MIALLNIHCITHNDTKTLRPFLGLNCVHSWTVSLPVHREDFPPTDTRNVFEQKRQILTLLSFSRHTQPLMPWLMHHAHCGFSHLQYLLFRWTERKLNEVRWEGGRGEMSLIRHIKTDWICSKMVGSMTTSCYTQFWTWVFPSVLPATAHSEREQKAWQWLESWQRRGNKCPAITQHQNSFIACFGCLCYCIIFLLCRLLLGIIIVI